MKFEKIDLSTWKRKEYFDHYFSNIPCTYSMSVKLDITRIKEQQIKLYPAMLYCLASVVNRHSEFRTAFDENHELGIYDEMVPSYTVFHRETETFSSIWTAYNSNFEEFRAAFEKDILLYGSRLGMTAKPDVPPNNFPVSMIPWVTFESFNLNLQKGYDYLSPIFTMGKFYREADRYLIPLSIQVHHAVCDGFHVCRFINEFQELVSNINR